jgi:hypothetical protein
MFQSCLRTVVGGLLLGSCVILIAACTTPTQAPTPTPVPAPAVDINNLAASPRIALQEAKAHFDAGSAIFLDVRSKSSFDRLHIEGALHIALEELDDRFNEIPKDQLIITYCT